MDISLTPGNYVIAVSGGVDSMVLLNLLQQQPGVKLTIAHFDHGIREDSSEDRQLVQAAARFYGLPFVYKTMKLGPGTSEATARTNRYQFLHSVRKASNARAIITAHHQDDALETAILNLLRGTGRKGLTSLGDHHDILRPMLHVPKADILRYAQEHDLMWREDSTNEDETYLRNYVRRRLLNRFTEADRAKFWQLISHARSVNQELDTALIGVLHQQSEGGKLDRVWFRRLPHDVAREVMAAWLRGQSLASFDRKSIERLVVAAKTSEVGKTFDVTQKHRLLVQYDHLALVSPER